MSECNSIEHGFYETPNMYPNLNAIQLSLNLLSDQQQFSLNKINEVREYFVAEIKER